ncbi:rCG57574 [Rattus norvegicus]|uniref:RCG57574 n=1 Tax=Rattus norvegicus TaxID=10116 RepID=A6JI89_RAT|nr:rCG57574 [Rattus norvegicus]
MLPSHDSYRTHTVHHDPQASWFRRSKAAKNCFKRKINLREVEFGIVRELARVHYSRSHVRGACTAELASLLCSPSI